MKETILGILESIIISIAAMIFVGGIALVGGCLIGELFKFLF